MKPLACIVGRHVWQTTVAEYRSHKERELGLPCKPATRTCTKCGKHQVQDIHCLGLSPPKYTNVWYTKND